MVGGGVVGAAVAYGLARQGREVTVLDGPGADLRASRANFGLVWVQGKGAGMPAYQQATRVAADLWPQFAAELTDIAALPVDHEQRGGLQFCLSDDEAQRRQAELDLRWQERRAVAPDHLRPHRSDEPDHEMLDRRALERLLPEAPLGPEVVAASYCWRDGYVNPLKLLHALHLAVGRLGGRVLFDAPVDHLSPRSSGGFVATAGGRRYEAEEIVVAAGLATTGLAAQLGLEVPVHPERGQVLVTERVAPMLSLPASGLRQTAEGTVTVGASQEDVGINVSTTVRAGATMAARACRILPALREARVVRQWAGLRVLTPDRCPVYATSPDVPGALAVACHSGVTLASFHALMLAPTFAQGSVAEHLGDFGVARFERRSGAAPRA